MVKKKYSEYGLYVLLGSLILSIIILSCVPPVSRDALTHHLAVPKLYLQHGGIHEISSMKFSYYPMNLELLYMIPMYFGNDIIPKLIHFAFALATAWIIFIYIKKRLNAQYGFFGVLLFLSTPIIIKLSITAYVDLGLVFFSTASLIFLLKWAENNYRVKYLLYSAVSCGFALGTKYNGLVILFLLTLFVPGIYLKRHDQCNDSDTAKVNTSLLHQLKAMGFGVVFFIVALLIFSPWMTRNYVWKKNPIYPLYDTIINAQPKSDSGLMQKRSIISTIKYNISKNKTNQWDHFSIRRIIYKESWEQIALIPIRIFFQGEDGNPKYFDGKLNPLLFFLPIFVFVFKRRLNGRLKKDVYIFSAFSLAFIIYAYISRDMRIRYIAPIIPPLVILSTFGFNQIYRAISEKSKKSKPYAQCIVIVFVSLFILNNIKYLIEQFKYVEPLSYICGEVNRDEYITKFRPEYASFQYMNRNLSYESKILGIFMGNRRYYSDRDMFFDDKLIFKAIKSNTSTREIFKILKKRSVTHILIWEEFFIQWTNVNLDKEELNALRTFFKRYSKLLFTKNGYTILSVSDFQEKETGTSK